MADIDREPPALLVVTGAAAAGKSTIGDHLRSHADLFVIDGDVLGRGAAAMSAGRRDYVDFWRFVAAISDEVRSNGLVPVVPCICLPAQVIAAVDEEIVHFLALVSDAATVQGRIAARVGVSEVPEPQTHVQFDATLRNMTVPAPHTLQQHDVSVHDVESTLTVAWRWAETKRRRRSPVIDPRR